MGARGVWLVPRVRLVLTFYGYDEMQSLARWSTENRDEIVVIAWPMPHERSRHAFHDLCAAITLLDDPPLTRRSRDRLTYNDARGGIVVCLDPHGIHGLNVGAWWTDGPPRALIDAIMAAGKR